MGYKTPKGVRLGGRKKGTPNKATAAREELARAQIAESLEKAKAAGAASPRNALNEMYKAITIAEGMAGKFQPRDVVQDGNGKVTIVGGDIKLFKEWFGLYFDCAKELAKYQIPQIKAVDAPTPPPDPGELERTSRKRFGLRVFDGGREVEPLKLGE